MPQNKKCQFKSDLLKDYTCPEPSLEGSNYCLFHKPNKTEDEAQLFKAKLMEKLQNKDYDFIGYCFPDVIDFDSQVFEERADFTESTFEGDINFRGATFKREANFTRSIFMGETHFEKSTFAENVNWRKSTFIEDAYFDSSTFEKDIFFARSKFSDYAGFMNSTFRGIADFWGSIFEETAKFSNSTFHRLADFEQAIVKKEASFLGSSFLGHVNFQGSTFKAGVTFDQTTFKEDVDFTGSMFERLASFRNINLKDNASAEQCYRIAKSSHQREGQYTLAGEYYYKEKIAKRKQLPRYSPKRWFEYILLDGICGYGERPLRAIRTGLGVLFGLAFLYWKVGHIYPSPELFNKPHTLTFWDALYFSVVTFTTLGFGDWRPDPSHWIRYVVMSEAFIGAFLMALFIVTFARRMMR